jgi:hypothetical protein
VKLVFEAPEGFRLEVLPLAPIPDDLPAWVERTMGAVGEHASEETETATGWPLALVTAADVVWGFVQVNPYVGAACVRGPGGTGWQEAAKAILRTARPDWRGDEVVSVADFYR